MKLMRRASADSEIRDSEKSGWSAQNGYKLQVYIAADGRIHLQNLQVSKNAPPGTGTKVLESLTRIADNYGLLLTVEPGKLDGDENMKGTTSLSRLKKFYLKFDFTPNSNKRDYRPDLGGTMHRNPRRAQIKEFSTIAHKAYYPKNWKTEEPFYTFNREEPFPAFSKIDEPPVNGIAGFFAADPKVSQKFQIDKNTWRHDQFRLKLGKTFTIDASGKHAGHVQFGESGKEFRDAIRSGEYDSISILNTVDEGTIYAMLNPNYIKLVNSDVSEQERFNLNNPDFRY